MLNETLDELELDPDPRRAVIQAYVRMEAVLGAHGHARLPHEAPLEYLARVLRELDVRAEAAHALTELFERARFSHHEIDAAMRAEAIASLAGGSRRPQGGRVKRVLLRWVPWRRRRHARRAGRAPRCAVDRELVLRIYALVVGGLALATLSAATAFAAAAEVGVRGRAPDAAGGYGRPRSSSGSSATSRSRSRTPRTSTSGSARRSSTRPTPRSGAATASRSSGPRI